MCTMAQNMDDFGERFLSRYRRFQKTERLTLRRSWAMFAYESLLKPLFIYYY